MAKGKRNKGEYCRRLRRRRVHPSHNHTQHAKTQPATDQQQQFTAERHSMEPNMRPFRNKAVPSHRIEPTTSPFAQRVYEAVSQIPQGEVRTYGDIAKMIGCRSAQAVGQALRHNPYAPEVPCHRVVAADGSLCGFFGKNDAHALRQKRQLLESEGIIFDANGKVACLMKKGTDRQA